MKRIQKFIGIALLLLSLFLWNAISLIEMEDTIKAAIAPWILLGLFLLLSRQNVFK